MKCYAVKHKDLNTRMASRSGGIFTAISDIILDQGGVVYGCRLNAQYMAEHARAETKEERNSFRGSKYVQSDKGRCFLQVKNDLKNGRLVLFSGTSCEVDGLIAFLGGGNVQNLITMDIICHGVPSPLIWQKYKTSVEVNEGSKIKRVEFRNKEKFGWASHYESINFENGNIYYSNNYASIFYSHLCLRPSCYHCPYKKIAHPSDITIADCWGIEKKMPDFNDNKGVSLVLVNTDKGQVLFDKAAYSIESLECNIQDFMQLPLRKPCTVNENRRIRFWKEVNSMPFEFIIKKYGNESIEEKLKKFIRCVIPGSMVDKLKKMLGR